MLESLSVADFAPLLASDLDFRAANGEFRLTLVAAEPLNQPSPRPAPAFRLLLQSSSGQRLPQGTFEMLHPVRGPLQLFMVPIQPDAGGSRFEIIFN